MSIKEVLTIAIFTTSLSSSHLDHRLSSISSSPTMRTTVAVASLVSFFCLLECSNVTPAKSSVEVVEIQEVVPAIPAKPLIVEEVVKPSVPLDVNVVKDRIHQSWPLLCLVPKAYILKPSLKLACPKFAVEATSKVVKKLAAQSPLKVNVLVTRPTHPVPVLKH